ncbi:MAG: hypothetical protein WA172_12975 [Terriglobales bacterium]
MKRFAGLAVITFFLLGCSSAFGQIYLGFLSNDMTVVYCDFEELYPVGFIASGIHENIDCGAPDGAMEGLKTTFPPSFLPLAGTYYAMGDTEFDAFCDCFTGDQAVYVTATQPYNIHAPQFGWEVLFNTEDAFYAYLDNWGYLIGDPPAPTARAEAKSKSKGPNVSFKPLNYSHSVM